MKTFRKNQAKRYPFGQVTYAKATTLHQLHKIQVILFLCIFFISYSAQAQWSNGTGGIYYNNRIGLGTSSPQTALHIAAGQSSTGGSGGFSLPSIRLSYTNSSFSPITTTNWDIESTGNLSFKKDGVNALAVTNSGINVYGSQIVLGSGTQQSYFSYTTHAATGKSGSAVVFGGKPVGSGYQFFGSATENGGGAIMADNDGNMYFLTKAAGGSSILNTPNTVNSMRMKLGNDGRVSIGKVTLPNSLQNTDGEEYSLFVRGGIYTQEVTVNLNNTIFPDYVFEADYNLPTLQEVETFITAHKHLPNTPSADALAKEGMNLKEITVVQQESIEQLYLYIIAMEKRIKELEAKQ